MTRILFVDDEPRILSGLRQSLRGKRKVWDMVFVESGAAALEAMQHTSFDVIISDMRMPIMDGAQLLSHAAVLQPQAARIVLSGQMDDWCATRAATVAHRFLLKPCDHELLETTVEKTLSLATLLNSDQIRTCVGGMATLPSLPKACQSLDRALKDAQAPIEAVVRIIESDVGMASKVLQLVNSSFFGANRKVSCISQAVNYLGLNTIRSLVLAQAMFQEFQGNDVVSFEHEQVRLQLCARIARQLIVDKRQAEAAATAALLHDVGHLVLASRMPVEQEEIVAFARQHGITLCEAEHQRLGTTHAEIGAYLLGLWGLPYDVIEAVAHHHVEWERLQALDVTTSVRLADGLACSLLCTNAQMRLHGDIAPPEHLDRLGVTETLKVLGDQLRLTLPAGTGAASRACRTAD